MLDKLFWQIVAFFVIFLEVLCLEARIAYIDCFNSSITAKASSVSDTMSVMRVLRSTTVLSGTGSLDIFSTAGSYRTYQSMKTQKLLIFLLKVSLLRESSLVSSEGSAKVRTVTGSLNFGHTYIKYKGKAPWNKVHQALYCHSMPLYPPLAILLMDTYLVLSVGWIEQLVTLILRVLVPKHHPGGCFYRAPQLHASNLKSYAPWSATAFARSEPSGVPLPHAMLDLRCIVGYDRFFRIDNLTAQTRHKGEAEYTLSYRRLCKNTNELEVPDVLNDKLLDLTSQLDIIFEPGTCHPEIWVIS